ncbi:MarR family transcriptional regulator [Aggregicoccus sp. 17bor-14]|uniref:MarR family winged helix-turn-helix transcriptional regulator n=1 Tax=Myxococcaceae TaxID=31 RepID=UPI00129C6935|nr:MULTISPECIES: MarR family transcriptional regulator [Myxococcaceae]MBF5041966.1 MarR family transcriptional regulator [Simulacricoccus sp. 17bor-14]MRI87747.1 MarR family transcriptional regulator [Aggregicoccus sp. 17bor-14]
MDPLLLEHQLCFALYAATRAMTQAYAPLLEPLGLTYPQYLVMLLLWEEDGLAVRQLGERLELDSGTLTPLLKRLEAAGLLRRARDRADERVVRIHLTAAGRSLKARARGIPRAVACSAGLQAGELTRLRTELRRLTHTLKENRP